MPIYEYECPKCGQFEITQRITEDPLKKCPTCRSRVRKLISNTSFHLKGSGWYVTDYGGKKGAAKDGGTKEGGAKESSSSGGEGTSDAKSATTESKSDSPAKPASGKKDASAKAA